MVKNIILYIFIYTLLVACSDNVLIEDECESNFTMNVEAPELEMDENGYYHIEWLDGYNQTFSTLEAKTGSGNNIYKVQWGSDLGIVYAGEFVSSVNSASYTNENGIANTVLSVWEVMINDTITIYSGYYDECNMEYFDSIKVVVKNEI